MYSVFFGVETLPDKLDTTIELILTRTQSKRNINIPKKNHNTAIFCKNIVFDYLNPADISDEYLLKLRIVRVEVSDGVFENIITTLSEEDFYTGRYKNTVTISAGALKLFSRLKSIPLEPLTNLHSKTEYKLHLNCGAGSFCTISVP